MSIVYDAAGVRLELASDWVVVEHSERFMTADGPNGAKLGVSAARASGTGLESEKREIVNEMMVGARRASDRAIQESALHVVREWDGESKGGIPYFARWAERDRRCAGQLVASSRDGVVLVTLDAEDCNPSAMLPYLTAMADGLGYSSHTDT